METVRRPRHSWQASLQRLGRRSPKRTLDTVPAPIYSFSPEGHCTYANQALAEAFGKPDFFQGHSVGLNKDHETTVYSPRRGQFVTFVVDTTERSRAEEELRRTYDTLVQAQKIAHLGSFEYVAATQTTVWSEEEYRIYGLDPTKPSPTYDEMLATCIHPEDAALLLIVTPNVDKRRLECRCWSRRSLAARLQGPDGASFRSSYGSVQQQRTVVLSPVHGRAMSHAPSPVVP